jgi:hypothetical protein
MGIETYNNYRKALFFFVVIGSGVICCTGTKLGVSWHGKIIPSWNIRPGYFFEAKILYFSIVPLHSEAFHGTESCSGSCVSHDQWGGTSLLRSIAAALEPATFFGSSFLVFRSDFKFQAVPIHPNSHHEDTLISAAERANRISEEKAEQSFRSEPNTRHHLAFTSYSNPDQHSV